jgi:methyl-accepting chemotaxis protein
MFKKMGLSVKLSGIVVVMGLGMLTFSGTGWWVLDRVKINGPIYLELIRGKDLIADILPPPEYIIESYLVTLQMLDEANKEGLPALLKRSLELKQEYDARHTVWADQLPQGTLRTVLLEDSYRPAIEFFRMRDEEFIPAIQAGDYGRARNLAFGAMRDRYQQHRTAIDEVVRTATADNTRVEENANGFVAHTLVMLCALGAGVLSASVVLSVFISRSITRPIHRVIEGLTEGSEQVSVASGQVSAASQSLAEGATEQAAGLEETSSSLEEMSAMTQQNAANAQQANTLAAEAKKAAGTGAESMSRMNAAIHDIQKSSDETAKIIKVIDEIAFQTNLLALNAAVEAARAGEAGKGFAVVAEEVRNLAMRSAEAAKNTASMIEESVKNSKNGVDIATEVGKVLDEIVQSVGKTTDLVSEIAAASQEQAQGIDQVNTAVSQMDKVTQQNAANAEESASASEELSAQAESMKEIVGQLVALVGGAGSQTAGSGATKPDRHHLSLNVEHKLRAAETPKSKSKPRGFGKSDEVLHKIAGRGGKPRHATAKPAARTIPLDAGDAEIGKFNS